MTRRPDVLDPSATTAGESTASATASASASPATPIHPATPDRHPESPVTQRLDDDLPWWFGPGNEPPALLGVLDAEGLGVLYQDAEAMIAWLRYVQAAAADRIVEEALAEVGDEPVELHGAGSRRDVREYAQSLVAEELKCLTGISEREAEARVSFVTAPAEATSRLAEAMRAGSCSWEKARYVHEHVAELDSIAADFVAGKALAAPRNGEVLSWRTFTDRVRRAVNAACSSETKRDQTRDAREAYAQLEAHGSGRFTITGEGARVIAAFERVDEQARRMRADGDPRTLKQLRSDIALDLILAGDLAGFPGALPAGRVAVTVSLASLISLTDAPGETRFGDLPAQIVRRIALAEGSTISRIVSDPVNGGVVDASTDSYRPTDRMRRFVTARDRSCRAPACSHAAERCDLDHGVNWPHGPTTPRNLTAKHRRHHEFKTRGWWQAEQHPDGTVSWRTLCGRYTTYPATYDADLIDEAETIVLRGVRTGDADPPDPAARPDVDARPTVDSNDSIDGVLAEIEARAEATWRRRWNAYRAEVDACGRLSHEQCAGQTAWASPIDPGLDCGRAGEPDMSLHDYLFRQGRAYRSQRLHGATRDRTDPGVGNRAHDVATGTPTAGVTGGADTGLGGRAERSVRAAGRDTRWDRDDVGEPPF